MKTLDAAYWRILKAGLIAVRDAATNGDVARCRAEAEHIHNIPSLIGEENVQRHLCYFSEERKAYMEWIAASGRAELKMWMSLAYFDAWREMDEALTAAGAANGQKTANA
jgi:hypothetical protein